MCTVFAFTIKLGSYIHKYEIRLIIGRLCYVSSQFGLMLSVKPFKFSIYLQLKYVTLSHLTSKGVSISDGCISIYRKIFQYRKYRYLFNLIFRYDMLT